MTKANIIELLNNVKNGTTSVEEAVLCLKKEPYTDLGYAKLDNHRGLRQGVAEVIYGAGKTSEQVLGIVKTLVENSDSPVLITRTDEDTVNLLKSGIKDKNISYDANCNLCIVGDMPPKTGCGHILVATGGTSDIPVAEEAALTAEVLGNEVVRLYDVGVAGIHRLLDKLDDIMNASVIIAVAGMEGALASVIGGLADCPVIAVPTSVGYGANFGGLSALLAMLNSCASGVSVVNIDNGFGAGYQASMINHIKENS
ncbi:MAG: nickel pincer cofactor biosynthesis protein LarB [Lachnospiraceae bacterium]|nr:nickel pincer cofactor biosynthesis protein LarB [Lachnospiraceae bacterium]